MKPRCLVKLMTFFLFSCLYVNNGIAADYHFGKDVLLTSLSSDTESLGQHSVAAKGKNVYMVVEYGGTMFLKSTDGGKTFGAPVLPPTLFQPKSSD